MSHSPYNMPNVPGYSAQGYGQGYGPFDPFDQLRRPARLCGIAMMIFAALSAGCGLILSAGSRVPIEQMTAPMSPEQAQQFNLINTSLQQMCGFGMQTAYLIIGIVMTAGSIGVFGLGIMVRKGGPGWLIGSLVVMGLLALVSVLTLLTSVATDPRSACMVLPGAAACVGISIGLIVALRNHTRIRDLQLQMQMQMYLQQQQSAQQKSQPHTQPAQGQTTAWPFPWNQQNQPPSGPPSSQS